MKKSKQNKMIIIIIAVVVIAITLVFSLNYRLQQAASNNYSNYLISITDKSLNLTRNHINLKLLFGMIINIQMQLWQK